jgi:hypothetical protein
MMSIELQLKFDEAIRPVVKLLLEILESSLYYLKQLQELKGLAGIK